MDLSEPGLSREPLHRKVDDDGDDETDRETDQEHRVLTAGSEHLVRTQSTPKDGLKVANGK